jgi:hypothetical protein
MNMSSFPTSPFCATNSWLSLTSFFQWPSKWLLTSLPLALYPFILFTQQPKGSL